MYLYIYIHIHPGGPESEVVKYCFFPRASERRVLPIVGVCISSSYLLSHLLIFTSAYLHICTSSHLLILTSSHLHICSSSHLLLFPPSLTPSHLHTFSSSHLLSHLLIFTSSLSLTLSPLSSFLSLSPFSLPFLSLAFFIFLCLG